MNKHILEQYLDIHTAIDICSRKIQRLEKKIARLEADGVVKDTVSCGTKGKKPIRTVKIEGVRNTDAYKAEIALAREKQEEEKAKLEELELSVDAYIDDISDLHVRNILNLRYMEQLSWKEIAETIGGNNTEDSVRKTAERYLQEKM